MDVEGGNLRNLTNSKGLTVVHRGRLMVNALPSHLVGIETKYDIYVMDADGGNLQRLTKDAESDYSPDWSRSAFSVSPASKQLLIWGWLKSESR